LVTLLFSGTDRVSLRLQMASGHPIQCQIKPGSSAVAYSMTTTFSNRSNTTLLSLIDSVVARQGPSGLFRRPAFQPPTEATSATNNRPSKRARTTEPSFLWMHQPSNLSPNRTTTEAQTCVREQFEVHSGESSKEVCCYSLENNYEPSLQTVSLYYYKELQRHV
jgi:hypothetical protein